jgi:hydrogenase maturation factor
MAVAKTKASRLVDSLLEAGVRDAVIVGEIVEKPKGKIIVRQIGLPLQGKTY